MSKFTSSNLASRRNARRERVEVKHFSELAFDPSQAPNLALLDTEAANHSLLSEPSLGERVAAYRAKLQATTDAQWRYQMASGADWRDGHRHFQAMREEQAVVDPSGEVWLSITPKGHDIPQPRLPGISCSQCGQGFGPGVAGFSHCADHAHLKAVAS